jgi:DNA-binding transcriptional LysR family regulator
MRSYPGDLLVHLSSFSTLVAHVKRRQQGAFERTAEELGVDRSVLRRRIQVLADWLGVPILEGRGVELQPSAQGARLADHATRLLTAANELRADVLGGHDRVSIACTGTITTELLPRVLLDLEKRPRPIRLVVKRAGGQACEALVRNGDVDLGVVRADAPPHGFSSLHLSDDRLWLVVPARHPLAKRPKPTLEQMASIPLVLYGEASRTRARVMDRLGPLGAAIRVEVESRSSALAYVRAGVGATFVSLLPGQAVDRRGARFHDVTALFDRSAFYVIGTKQRWASANVTDVLRELSKHRPRGMVKGRGRD